MNHFITDTLPLIVFGLTGVMITILIKINELNHRPENDAVTFQQILRKFFHREWAAYGTSVLVVLATAFSHDEWLVWFSTGGRLNIGVPIGIKIAMIAWGMLGQWLLYKFVFGKIDKIDKTDFSK
jgi:hypothetical protein